jgi:DNA polymerase-3 subunit delta'
MQWHEEITEGSKETQKNFLLYFIQLLEHTVRYRIVGRTNMTLLENELKIIENLISKGLSDHMIEEMSHLINDALFQIERNANTKILFHALSLRIQQIILRKKAMA